MWINIEDRKPANSVYVLVALYDSRPDVQMHFIQIAERMNENWHNGHDGDSILRKGSYVTHWMPLPDVPSLSSPQKKEPLSVEFLVSLQRMLYEKFENNIMLKLIEIFELNKKVDELKKERGL